MSKLISNFFFFSFFKWQYIFNHCCIPCWVWFVVVMWYYDCNIGLYCMCRGSVRLMSDIFNYFWPGLQEVLYFHWWKLFNSQHTKHYNAVLLLMVILASIHPLKLSPDYQIWFDKKLWYTHIWSWYAHVYCSHTHI